MSPSSPSLATVSRLSRCLSLITLFTLFLPSTVMGMLIFSSPLNTWKANFTHCFPSNWHLCFHSHCCFIPAVLPNPWRDTETAIFSALFPPIAHPVKKLSHLLLKIPVLALKFQVILWGVQHVLHGNKRHFTEHWTPWSCNPQKVLLLRFCEAPHIV